MRAEIAAGLFSGCSLIGLIALHILSPGAFLSTPTPMNPFFKQILFTLFPSSPYSTQIFGLISAFYFFRLLEAFVWRTLFTVVWVFIAAKITRRLAAGPALDPSFPADLTGKVALVTGCSKGTIGFWTALHLAHKGATVIIGCRSNQRSQQAATAIKQTVAERYGDEAAGALRLVTNMGSLELESFDCVRAFAKNVNTSGLPLHYLVNNAGLIPSAKKRFSSYEGTVELSTCVNFLSPYLLTELLAPLIQKSRGRVVFVSSSQHAHVPYDPHFASRIRRLSESRFVQSAADLPSPIIRYNYSKLGNIFTAHHTVTKWNIPTTSLHPGFCTSEIMGTHLPSWIVRLYQTITIYILTKTDEEGATTSLHCCLMPEEQIRKATKPFETRKYKMTTENRNFSPRKTALMAPYFCDCEVHQPSDLAQDERVYEEVMEWARKAIKF